MLKQLNYTEDSGWNLFTCSVKYQVNNSKIICYVNKEMYYESSDLFNKKDDSSLTVQLGLGKLDVARTSSTFTHKRALILRGKKIIREEVEDMLGQEWFPTSYPSSSFAIPGVHCSKGPTKH